MLKRKIRLRGVNGVVDGRTWESETFLRAGRLNTLELVLDDASVSRRHAEVKSTPIGWRIRDLGSTNGTFLNGSRLSPGEFPLHPHDILRFGNVTVVVDAIRETRDEANPSSLELTVGPDRLKVEATENRSWEDALSGLLFDKNRSPRPGEQLLALLRAGHYLTSIETEEDLLHNILNDAVSTLEAQRGAIVLSDPESNQLKLRALASGHSQIPSRPGFSQNLAMRCFTRGESILCSHVDEDPELAGARSIAEGTMASVLCVLLRTPRRRIGVLHLDRGPMQEPFTTDDLNLADAMAAHVSAGIECAEMQRKQRDLFYATITMLAQAVEMRDEYTGGHTARVTQYSTLLAQHLDVSAKDLHLIRIGTPLHDIGKIGIDDAILRKPGKLTPSEFEVMKTHTTKGAKILEQVVELHDVIPIVRSHHERWDGMGYPDGLAGTNIPMLARIVAVADAFDAMTSDRPYRKGMPPEQAFAEVEKNKGKQFDPEIAEKFLRIRSLVVQEMQAETHKLEMPRTTLRIAR